MIRKVSIFLLFFIILFSSQAQTKLTDTARVSLMTVEPWDEAVYTFYGHTAIRIQDDSLGLDVAFNYGYFDPTQPNFLYHFVRGETDYILGNVPYSQFLNEYGQKKAGVIEQELNMMPDEKQNLWEALYINALPENRGYRYNFLFDNCATRPRDMIEKYIKGKIQYPPTEKQQTFRDLLHESLDAYPWNKFGVDLVIGSGADTIIGVREKMFLPMYLMHSFQGAQVVKNDTISYPLVKSQQIVLNAANKEVKDGELGWFTPIVAAFALLFLTLLVSVIQVVKMNKTILPKIYDTLLFGVAGIGGMIIFFLLFFSEHPATNPNWNFVWLNIVALFMVILFWVRPAKKAVYFYHFINFAVLTLFVLFWWLIPQKLPVATIPFSMSLLIRSLTNVYMLRKRKIKNKRYTSFKQMKAGWGQ